MARNERRPRKTDTRVPRARSLRKEMTEAERRLWWRLRGLKMNGTHFRRQAVIGPYFADFACHRCRLVIEIDGGQHNFPDRAAADAARTAFLESRGYRVLRFWNNEVLQNIEGVMQHIFDTIALRTGAGPPPQTPPRHAQARGGRGTRNRKV
jgi:very-short-patch-repair endonuclease